MRCIKLRHELVHAQYDEASAKWRLRIRRPVASATAVSGTGAEELEYVEFEDTADVVLSGAGGLSRWQWPDIDGLKSFKGKLVHSAEWDVGEEGDTWQESVKDWSDKKVGVIGVVRGLLSFSPSYQLSNIIFVSQGSSAIQIVPSLQPRVASLKNYVRGKTWLATPFVSEKLAQLMKRAPESANCAFYLSSAHDSSQVLLNFLQTNSQKMTGNSLRTPRSTKRFDTNWRMNLMYVRLPRCATMQGRDPF